MILDLYHPYFAVVAVAGAGHGRPPGGKLLCDIATSVLDDFMKQRWRCETARANIQCKFVGNFGSDTTCVKCYSFLVRDL